MPRSIDLGRLRIWTADRKDTIIVQCRLGRSEPRVVDGYAGWSLVTRYRRRALVEWAGSNPLLIQVTFMIDRWDDVGDGEPGEGNDVENRVRQLERMAGLDEHQPEPPQVKWVANAPHDNDEAAHLTWVIESLEWEEGSALYNHAGNRVRQAGTLLLRQFESDEFLTTGAALVTGENKGKGSKSTYRVREGDTLSKIAKNRLGNARRWPEILRLNKGKIRDPDKLKVDMVITLPAKKK